MPHGVIPSGSRPRTVDLESFADLHDDPHTLALTVLDREQGMNGCGRLVVLACVMTIQACLVGSLWEEALGRPISEHLLCAPGVHFMGSLVLIGVLQMEFWQCGHLYLAITMSRCRCTGLLFLLLPKLGLASVEMVMGLPFIWRAQLKSELVLNILLLTFVARLDDNLSYVGMMKLDPAIQSAFLEQVTKEKKNSLRCCNVFMTLVGCCLWVPTLVSLYNACP